jgi:hypothetical protein
MSNPTHSTQPWQSPKARRRFPEHPPAPRDLGNVRLTDRDLEVLAFVAAHRFVSAVHVHDLLGTSRSITYRLLGRLTDCGLLRYERIFHGQPGVFLTTNGGLAVIDSPLQRPVVDLRLYRHELSVPTLWLVANAGGFGAFERVVTEREAKHYDQIPARQDGGMFGVRLTGFDRAGRPMMHHADVIVSHPDQTRTGIELELSLKGRRRLEQIVLGYVLDDRYRRVVYLADQAQVAGALNGVVGEYGAEEKVRVLCLAEISRTAVAEVIAEGGRV